MSDPWDVDSYDPGDDSAPAPAPAVDPNAFPGSVAPQFSNPTFNVMGQGTTASAPQSFNLSGFGIDTGQSDLGQSGSLGSLMANDSLGSYDPGNSQFSSTTGLSSPQDVTYDPSTGYNTNNTVINNSTPTYGGSLNSSDVLGGPQSGDLGSLQMPTYNPWAAPPAQTAAVAAAPKSSYVPPAPTVYQTPNRPAAAAGALNGANTIAAGNPYQGANNAAGAAAGALSGQQAPINLNNQTQLNTAATGGLTAGNSILNTAFDPQLALEKQLQQQNTDQTNVAEAQRGITMSPYGAGVANQSNQNFDIAWQNAQLGRQVAGLGAYDTNLGASGTAMNNATAAGNQAVTNTANVGALPYAAAQAGLGNTQTATQDYLQYLSQGTQSDQAATENYPSQIAQQGMQNYGGVPMPQSPGSINNGTAINTASPVPTGNLQNLGISPVQSTDQGNSVTGTQDISGGQTPQSPNSGPSTPNSSGMTSLYYQLIGMGYTPDQANQYIAQQFGGQ